MVYNVEMVKYVIDGRPIVERASALSPKMENALRKVGIKMTFFVVTVSDR